MNFKGIYNKATTPASALDQAEAEKQKQEQDFEFAKGLVTQNHKDWLKLPQTQNLLSLLETKVEFLLDSSMLLACDPNVNPQQLINKLVSADTQRKIIDYVRNNKSN